MGTLQLLPFVSYKPSVSEIHLNGFHWLTHNVGRDTYTLYLLGAQNPAYLGVYVVNGTYHRVIGARDNAVSAYLNTFPSGMASEMVGYTTAGIEHNGYYYSDISFNDVSFVGVEPFSSLALVLNAFDDVLKNYHPIHYSHSAGCTITGQADAPSGQDVVVTVNVQSGYQFKGASGVRIVDTLEENVPFVVNGNQFSFTMPQFSETATETGVYVTVSVIPDNPYSPGGNSGESSGGGEFELENSPIPLPALPSLNILNTGFVHAYAPTLSELQAFQNWLWVDNPFESVWRNIMGNPYDYIMGLRAIPVTPETGTAQPVALGNVTASVNMKPVTQQYKRVDFGTVDFREFSKSFLDYSPYTRVTLYLPFIGFVKIDADIINEKTIGIQYSVDVLSGAFMAFVIAGEKALYSFSGSMGADVPVNSQSYNNILSGIIGTVGGVASLVAAGITGGLAVPMGISGASNAIAGIVNAAKPSVEHGNGLSGVPGVMGANYPFFIIMRPMQSIPENVQEYTGFPANLLLPLNDVSGFTKVEYCHLENISATEAEKAEIMSLLKEGVIF